MYTKLWVKDDIVYEWIDQCLCDTIQYFVISN